MNWKRPRAGLYVAGPFRIERLVTRWQATGPNIAETHDHKSDAQRACERVAELRAADPDANAPVIGDYVLVLDGSVWAGKRGQVASIMTTSNKRLLFCLKSTRNKRICLFREEIEVVVP